VNGEKIGIKSEINSFNPELDGSEYTYFARANFSQDRTSEEIAYYIECRD